MNIISENVRDNDIALSGLRIQDAIDYLVNFSNKLVDKVQKEYLPIFHSLIRNLTGETKGVVYGKKLEQLDIATLISFAKLYIVENSNEIVAIKVDELDHYLLYLSYSKDRELLPIRENRYLVIKARTLTQEVSDLFLDSNLIILK